MRDSRAYRDTEKTILKTKGKTTGTTTKHNTKNSNNPNYPMWSQHTVNFTWLASVCTVLHKSKERET